MTALELKNVSKSFGDVEVLHDINLTVDDGEFVVFVGPSGCGKSTLLRIVAGLEEPTLGDVNIAGREVTSTAPAKRGIAMVFQSYALYPHLTVRDNMALGLKQAGTPKEIVKQRVDGALKLLALDDYAGRRPSELSGGQRQRVAIGRAIVREPDLFLFDEPLSNLDAALRVNMRMEITKLHQKLKTAMIYVTHDQTEAMTLADRIVVLRNGYIEQIGTPKQLYNDPDNKFVAGFLGAPRMNFLKPSTVGLSHKGSVGIRPEHIEFDISGTVKARVVHVEFLGGDTNIIVQIPDEDIVTIRKFGQHFYEVGQELHLKFDPSNIFKFDENENRVRF